MRPQSGPKARRVNIVRKFAFGPTIRMSNDSARDMPAPAQTPSMAAMVGLSINGIAIPTPLTPMESFFPGLGFDEDSAPGSSAVKSAPAENPLPSCVATTARTSGSVLSRRPSSIISQNVLCRMAFNFSGLIICHSAILSLMVIRSSSKSS